jgi:carboxyl-terminal processing protease
MMSLRSKFALVLLSAAVAFYAVVGGWMSTRAQQQQNDPGSQLIIFESVLQHIQRDYVDEPNLEKVRAGALRGLANGLDPYSTYLTAEQVKDYQNGGNKTAVGIGAELSQLASYLYIVAPTKGGPADLAGLKPGDVIEYIDGKATRDISLYDARQLLQGASGTEVKLRVLRQRSRPLTIAVKRGAVKVPAAEAKLEAGKIGVIKVNSLEQGEAADVKARLLDLQKQGAQKIVLDLRSVAGGALMEGVGVANLFIKDGALAQTIGRSDKQIKSFDADPKNHVFAGPTAVLIDNGTAGAAEIVASAFLERKRGEVVGERSFGSGAEQQLFTLRNGDGLLLTTVKWASGDGKPFLGEDRDKSGVEPSVKEKAAPASDAATDDDDDTDVPGATPAQPTPPVKQPAEDLQMKKALELLRGNDKSNDKVAAN